MSHGGGSEGGVAEPNLTPLLDVVLQLLMFFMMCVNFVSEQVNEDIKLPSSQAVKPMDKNDPDVLFVNVKPFAVKDFQDRLPADALVRVQEKFREGDDCILVPGEEPMTGRELIAWLKRQHDNVVLVAEQKGKEAKDVNTAIVIRGDKNAVYGQVFDIMHKAKGAGFHRLSFRAMTKNTPGGGK